MTRTISIAVVLISVLALCVFAVDGDGVIGVWATEFKKAYIEISRDGDKYNGRIVWLAEPDYAEGDDMAGQPKVDRNNPEEELRGRSILGMPLMKDFVYVGDNEWKNGRIYDAENGKTYKCKLKLTDEGILKVRGYVGFSMLGRTTEWTRVPADSLPADVLTE